MMLAHTPPWEEPLSIQQKEHVWGVEGRNLIFPRCLTDLFPMERSCFWRGVGGGVRTAQCGPPVVQKWGDGLCHVQWLPNLLFLPKEARD